MEERQVFDKYGIELKGGDCVCFLYKPYAETYLVKAIVKEIKPMKKDEHFPSIAKANEHRGWVIIDKYVDDWLNNDKKTKKKVIAERVVKCY